MAVKDSFVDFLTANDKSAMRVSDAAARASAHLGEDLDRGDLTPEERMKRHETEECLVKDVSDDEKRVRKSNERVFTIAAFVIVTIVGGAAAAATVRNSRSQ